MWFGKRRFDAWTGLLRPWRLAIGEPVSASSADVEQNPKKSALKRSHSQNPAMRSLTTYPHKSKTPKAVIIAAAATSMPRAKHR